MDLIDHVKAGIEVVHSHKISGERTGEEHRAIIAIRGKRDVLKGYSADQIVSAVAMVFDIPAPISATASAATRAVLYHNLEYTIIDYEVYVQTPTTDLELTTPNPAVFHRCSNSECGAELPTYKDANGSNVPLDVCPECGAEQSNS